MNRSSKTLLACTAALYVPRGMTKGIKDCMKEGMKDSCESAYLLHSIFRGWQKRQKLLNVYVIPQSISCSHNDISGLQLQLVVSGIFWSVRVCSEFWACGKLVGAVKEVLKRFALEDELLIAEEGKSAVPLQDNIPK